MVTADLARNGGPVSAATALGRSVDRLATGLSDWDEALHGGPVFGSTLLLYGPPGSGKSSEALRLAGAIAERTASKALVLSCEMPEELIASYCARLCVPLDRLDLWHVHAWKSARRAIGPSYRAIVVDSFQPFALGSVQRVLADLSAATQAVRIVIARVNRKGEPSGVRDLDHDVDVVCRITRTSIQIPTKNRFAPLGSAKRVSSGSVDRPGSGARRSGRPQHLRPVE